jgi:hypothetical protein
MRNRASHAEIISLTGEKVHLVNDCKTMDLSKLRNDIYLIRYHDKCGNIIGQEKIVKK